MGFFDNGLGNTTALCVGLTSAAIGLPSGAIEASIGGAGLVGFVLGKKAKFGPECARVRKGIQKKILGSYSHLTSGSDGNWQARQDLEAADHALHECLGDCMIDRGRLAAAAVTPKGFPEQAVLVVFEELAIKRPDLFGNLNAQGRYEEAEPLYSKALEIFERGLGEEHPNTLICYNNLAIFLDNQGRHEEAEEYRKKAGK